MYTKLYKTKQQEEEELTDDRFVIVSVCDCGVLVERVNLFFFSVFLDGTGAIIGSAIIGKFKFTHTFSLSVLAYLS